MKTLAYEITVGIGDNLVMRVFLDTIKHNYDRISISHSREVMRIYRNNDPKYWKFLDDLGTLLFSEPPYVFTHDKNPPIHTMNTIRSLGITPRKPNLDHLLCKGQSLNVGQEYIVLTTKARVFDRIKFLPQSVQLWATLKKLSEKYKIVILGEREVEQSKEYAPNKNTIFGIYEQIIANLPADRIIDLTIPALGITAPELTKIQQDCVIMKEAKFVITLGIGGNFWLAVSVANTIGYRTDTDWVTDLISNPHYPSAFITKDWNQFINKLGEYL